VWSLVVSQWWEAWCTYTKGLSAGDAMEGPPGPIDNSSLLLRKESRELKADLIRGEDYQVGCRVMLT
jgi:hypothetical protein